MGCIWTVKVSKNVEVAYNPQNFTLEDTFIRGV